MGLIRPPHEQRPLTLFGEIKHRRGNRGIDGELSHHCGDALFAGSGQSFGPCFGYQSTRKSVTEYVAELVATGMELTRTNRTEIHEKSLKTRIFPFGSERYRTQK